MIAMTKMKELVFSLTLGGLIVSGPSAVASQGPEAAKEKERSLIAILKSAAPPQDKAVPCKLLAIYGTRDAVPALAELLTNPDLSSWARIALEAIPDSAADDVLRAALPKVQGKLLVGVINSIGTRRDPKAVPDLIKLLKDGEVEIASAVAIALGHIGGNKAASALANALTHSAEGVKGAVAEGCILCAEKMLAQGKRNEATKLYDTTRKANVPEQRILEATRGAILARGRSGLPLLMEGLRSNERGMLSIALHTARELPGREVTDALAAELRRAGEDRQTYLLLAISDRNDPSVLPAVIEAARSGSVKLRLVAVGILDRKGNSSSLPTLLEVAESKDSQLSAAAVAALARMPGNKVDSDLLERLPQSKGKTREILIDLAGQRRIEAALPVIVESASSSDARVRAVAIQAIGVMGGAGQAADIVRLLPSLQEPKERSSAELALIEISSRAGAACVPRLLPLMHSDDGTMRAIGLHALESAGGSDALSAVRTAVEDKDESVRDEAVRTLSTWPNNWPDDAAVAEPLLRLAREGKSMSQQVLGMRGYLQYVKGDKALKDDDRVSKVSELIPLLKRPEEKRLAIAAIDGIPTSAVVELLMNFAGEPAIADDACSALLSVTGKKVEAVSSEQRQKALQEIVAKTTNLDTKKRAEELLKKLL